ncbi:MAG: hypothetical protein JNM68_10220 [Dinghuibacter sp.]|nr:hypothetical protein [Dinghuibacter sp.]
MITVKKLGILLKKRALGFECEGVLNPAVIAAGNSIHLFYRAVGKGNYSTVGYCRLSDPFTVADRPDTPVLYPQTAEEAQGVEDPRIVQIGDTYYLTYTAYNGVNALGALALSTDLVHFTKLGIISPQVTYETFQHLAGVRGDINGKYLRYNKNVRSGEHLQSEPYIWDKNLVFFPERINGMLCFLHRIRPDIQLVMVNELSELTDVFWQQYFMRLETHIVLTPKYEHEVSYIGGGCPPVKTRLGWLLIYHGVCDSVNGYVYSACAALLQLNDPRKEIARLPYPLFTPDQEWELKGEVNNVCFPTGLVIVEGMVYIYYGAADEQIAVATVSLVSLLDELMLYTENDEH